MLTRKVDEMESHERTEKCKEIFSLLSEYLDPEPCIEFAGYRPTELPQPMGKEAREQLLGAYRKALAARSGT
jgi:hypothetical protein